MKTTIQIKSIFGKLLFEFEKEDNSVRETLQEALKQDADLQGADLQGADLRDADLRNADLRNADLRNANLRNADLRNADLRNANLRNADLRNANLRNANLRNADLRNANLRNADLRNADLRNLIKQTTILPQGDLIVWKKLSDNVIAKLLVPAKAKRVNAAGSRKCRFEFVQTLALYQNGKFLPKSFVGIGKYDSSTTYEVGKITEPDSFDPSPLIECSHGIHAFITRKEAVEYN